MARLPFSRLVLLLAIPSSVSAFVPRLHQKNVAPSLTLLYASENSEDRTFDPLGLATFSDVITPRSKSLRTKDLANGIASVATVLTAAPAVSHAAGPDWGIFEGKTGSIIHPIMMGSLFLFGVNTGLKGFDWRRQRTIGDEISTLKKQLPTLPEGVSTIREAIEQGKGDGTDVSIYEAALIVESEISSLTGERKELSSRNSRDKHYSQGALLAFLGTAFAIEGCLNTYGRAGKLFPGPHLFAGAGLVVCWAAASACVPAMQKGNDTARSLHIGANVLGMLLFAWQVQSGIPILLKVWELTKWP